MQTFLKFCEEGYWVLALAYRKGEDILQLQHADESQMTFLGFLLFFDPLKQKKPSEHRFPIRKWDSTLKVITGDNAM